jgi:hypothetical protein
VTVDAAFFTTLVETRAVLCPEKYFPGLRTKKNFSLAEAAGFAEKTLEGICSKTMG